MRYDPWRGGLETAVVLSLTGVERASGSAGASESEASGACRREVRPSGESRRAEPAAIEQERRVTTQTSDRSDHR